MRQSRLHRTAGSERDLILRPLGLEDLPAQQALLSKTFPDSAEGGYTQEYPLVFPARPPAGAFGVLTAEGRLLSQVSYLERALLLGSVRLYVALVGSVATAPDSRGQQLAGRLLQATHAHLDARGCLLTLLWSRERPLYSTLGYLPVGRHFLVRLEPLPDVPPAGRVRVATASDRPHVHALACTRANTLARTLEEHEALSAIPGMRSLVVEGPSGIEAFGFLGRGSDFPNIMHDWHGSDAALKQLLCTLSRERTHPYGVLCPDLPHPLTAWLLDAGLPYQALPAAQLRVKDPARLLEHLTPLLPRVDRVSLERILSSQSPDENGKTAAFLSTLFGPTPGHPPSILPLPFMIWGLDSV